MAIVAYLKTAAQLWRAAQTRKQESDEARAEISANEADTDRQRYEKNQEFAKVTTNKENDAKALNEKA